MTRYSVLKNIQLARFEGYFEGEHAGYLQYEMRSGEMWILHTIVEHRHRGHHLEEALIEAALHNAHKHCLAVLPFCSLTRRYLTDHPQYTRLVPEEHRERLGIHAEQGDSGSSMRDSA